LSHGKSQIAAEIPLYTLANTLEKRRMITLKKARKHHDNGRIKPGQHYIEISGKRDCGYYTAAARKAGMTVENLLNESIADGIRKDAAGRTA
jgi:hypothetical protein